MGIGERTKWAATVSCIRKFERKITEIEVQYRDSPLDEIPDDLSGNFEGFPQYSWRFSSKDFEMPDLTSILVASDEVADETLISMISQMSDFISDSIKEGTVTVSVQAGKTAADFSVTTYFVDYNKPLSLGGGD